MDNRKKSELDEFADSLPTSLVFLVYRHHPRENLAKTMSSKELLTKDTFDRHEIFHTVEAAGVYVLDKKNDDDYADYDTGTRTQSTIVTVPFEKSNTPVSHLQFLYALVADTKSPTLHGPVFNSIYQKLFQAVLEPITAKVDPRTHIQRICTAIEEIYTHHYPKTWRSSPSGGRAEVIHDMKKHEFNDVLSIYEYLQSHHFSSKDSRLMTRCVLAVLAHSPLLQMDLNNRQTNAVIAEILPSTRLPLELSQAIQSYDSVDPKANQLPVDLDLFAEVREVMKVTMTNKQNQEKKSTQLKEKKLEHAPSAKKAATAPSTSAVKEPSPREEREVLAIHECENYSKQLDEILGKYIPILEDKSKGELRFLHKELGSGITPLNIGIMALHINYAAKELYNRSASVNPTFAGIKKAYQDCAKELEYLGVNVDYSAKTQMQRKKGGPT